MCLTIDLFSGRGGFVNCDLMRVVLGNKLFRGDWRLAAAHDKKRGHIAQLVTVLPALQGVTSGRALLRLSSLQLLWRHAAHVSFFHRVVVHLTVLPTHARWLKIATKKSSIWSW